MDRRRARRPLAIRLALGLCAVLPSRHRDVVRGDLLELWELERASNPSSASRRILVEAIRGTFGGGIQSLRTTRERRVLDTWEGRMPRSTERVGKGSGWGRDFVRDLKVAGRRMRRAPGFTAVALLSIALGVGANTALFTLIEELILKDPPFADAEELVDIRLVEEDDAFGTFSYISFRELEEATTDVFEGVAGVMFNMVGFNDGSGRNQNLINELVVGPYFQVLGVGAQVGRVFAPDEGVDPGADPIAVLSDRFWRTAFDADPGVVGSAVILNGHPYTVVGVADPGFAGVFPGLTPDIWAPATMADQISLNGPGSLTRRGQESIMVKARLADGVSLAQAQTVAKAFGDDLFPRFPDNYAGHSVAVTPTLDSPIHPALDGVVVPLAALVMTVVGLVLLIACVNLAGFLLARAEGRRREIAVRIAMGAGRGRLVRSLLTETGLLALVGGAMGVIVSVYLVNLLLGIELPLPVPIEIEASLNARVFSFALGVSLVAGLILGLAPALQTTSPDISGTLKDETTGGSGRALRLRDVLVVGQVAGSAVLLIVAGLFIRSLVASQSIDPGFGHDPAAIVGLELPNQTELEDRRAFFDQLMERTAALPGVLDVGMITLMPLETTGTSTIGITVAGIDPPPGRTTHEVDWAAVGGDFFPAVGMELVAGRAFESRDDLDSDPVAIVNEAMAARFWPEQDPVGRVFVHNGSDTRIVGVVANTKVRSLSEAPRPMIYRPNGQQTSVFGRFVARTTMDPAALGLTIVEIATELNPGVIVINSRTMEQHLAFLLIPARISAIMLGLMGLLALLLAAIGLYGIVAYSVAARVREMGIRMSVGAEPGRLVSMVLGGGMKRVALGLGIGLAVAIPISQILRGSLYGVGSVDLATYLIVTVLLAGVAALAAYVPARRASRVDPVTALRGS